MSLRHPGLWLIAGLALVGCSEPAAYTVVHDTQPLPEPTRGEAVVLRVATPNGERPFTMRQLKALRAVEYRTRHPAMNRDFLYRGVLLSDLANATGLKARDLQVEAMNDYRAVIPWKDYGHYPLLLAYQADGEPISVEEKGPLTVVLPTHAYPRRFPDLKYGEQWVWYVNAVKAQ